MNIHLSKLWIQSLVLGIVITVLATGYIFFQRQVLNLLLFNKALAASSFIMIDVSFILSGTSYFWGLGTSKLGYRKMIGVVGFGMSLLHAATASVVFTGSPVWIWYLIDNPVPLLPAFFAILIMSMMVSVSNWGMPKRLGAKFWRRLLRVGYVAIILIMLHAFLLSADEWLLWIEALNTGFSLPPLSLLVWLFSVATLMLRVALFISLAQKKRIALGKTVKSETPTYETADSTRIRENKLSTHNA